MAPLRSYLQAYIAENKLSVGWPVAPSSPSGSVSPMPGDNGNGGSSGVDGKTDLGVALGVVLGTLMLIVLAGERSGAL